MEEGQKKKYRTKELAITYFYQQDGEALETILKRYVKTTLLQHLQENDTSGYRNDRNERE